MTKHQHWDILLHDFLLSRATAPFAYGSNDCCSFAAAGIEAMTGVNIAEHFSYTTEAGALKAIRKVTGGSTVEDAAVYCANKCGMPELKHPLTARRGDLVLIDDSGSMLMGLVHLNGREAVAPGADGLRRLPLTLIKRAWRTNA